MSTDKQKHETDSIARITEATTKCLWSFSFLTWHGSQRFLQLLRANPFQVFTLASGWCLIIEFGIRNAWHLRFMEWIWPTAFHGRFLDWLYAIPIASHLRFIYFVSTLITLVILGAGVLRKRQKLKECFEAIGLKNGVGQTPALAWHNRIDSFTEKYGFYGKGIGIDQFQAKRFSIESALGREVESISSGRTPDIIELTTTSRVLPSLIEYRALRQGQKSSNESFYIGESKRGVLTATITELPHLMIAGTTGGGKSIFFKQVIAGLLETSPHLQVYLIDLKRGLEAKDFDGIPTVAIAKDVQGAVSMLSAIEREMERRFKFLESKNLKEIVPARDQKDRIVVAVDEASELYAEKSKFDDDYELSLTAQKITNSIARLGRAAGIHLILSTQKVNKESINTIIQENISARMCFKMNTLQGSLQVLGSKDALDLPSTRGRGIWQHGSEQVTVQVPFIDSKTAGLTKYQVGLDIAMGYKKPLQDMLVGMPSVKAASENSNSVRELIAKFDA